MQSNSLKKNRNKSLLAALFCFGLMNSCLVLLSTAIASSQSVQQAVTVTGVVTDDSGEPIIGASAVVKGTNNGVITDLDGNFSLRNVAPGATIEISFIGYVTAEVKADGARTLTIRLKEDAKTLPIAWDWLPAQVLPKAIRYPLPPELILPAFTCLWPIWDRSRQ